MKEVELRRFCDPSHFGNKTEVFAVEYDRADLRANGSHYYPMAWDPANTEVPGINRTEFYRKVCRACGNATGVDFVSRNVVL